MSEKRKKETKKVVVNGVEVSAYKYEGDLNWVVDGE